MDPIRDGLALPRDSVQPLGLDGVTKGGATITRAEWRWVAVVSFAILALNSLPYALGYLSTPPDLHYSGLLFNAPDANSYLAKMLEGMRGEWLFTLPYTDSPGPGAFLLTHYLLLGHVAAALRLDAIVVYNAARIVGGAVLLVTLYAFAAHCSAEIAQRRFAFLLAALGSGLGWLALMFGAKTPDWSLAEAYPFLSIFANAHFPWSMAALLWVFMACLDARKLWSTWLGLVGGGLLLAVAQPFGLVSIAASMAPWLGASRYLTGYWNRPALLRLGVIGAIGVPFLLYDQWVTAIQPALGAWAQQNITQSPPPWDYLFAGGLVLACALAGSLRHRRCSRKARVGEELQDLLVWWLLTSAVLVYLPFSLQRRFTFGLFVPLAILAAEVVYLHWRARPSWRFAFLLCSSLTNVLLLLVAFLIVSMHPAELYFSQDEWAGLQYLHTSAPPQSVVLASPEMGSFIPAWAGQRVIYGHAFETPQAELHRAEVEQFFRGTLSETQRLLQSTDYVFLGPRERLLGTPVLPPDFAPVWVQGKVTIFQKMDRAN
jgi:hypothetical protein